MAGHNKWSKIKHKKAKEDVKRGKIFTRFGREIQVAARAGGPDPNYNAALRTAVERAMAENMPNENIQRAIKRGAGLLPGQEIEEISYEGYGPSGVAVIVSCLTDNKNRTVSEVRHAFTKASGSLGENGSVAWMFKRIGLIRIRHTATDEETMMDAAIESGAGDVRSSGEDDIWEFICGDTEINTVRETLLANGFDIVDSLLAFEPENTIELQGSEAQKVLTFIDTLDQLDDVQDVYANISISDEEFERLAAAM
ncbi:probable transcriptional regulatory protein NIS_0560 [Ylistrum balloti]|uniref:probable transcriptional regulatory protein NIS_0560 n=1 Tax=Ylistrum balloti TaxID=509963 RepID=UPI002905E37F|nr:probable transcriptional regulatory protein NIS_0560 [Ylistrum balloti]